MLEHRARCLQHRHLQGPAAWRKDGASASCLPFPQEPHDAPILLSCPALHSPLLTVLGTRLVLALSTGDEPHFLSVLTPSTMAPVLVERADFPGVPRDLNPLRSALCFQARGAECELPEGEGPQEGSGTLASASCHKPYNKSRTPSRSFYLDSHSPAPGAAWLTGTPRTTD